MALSLKANIDFEEVLNGLPSKKLLNESLEFFILWLEDQPLYSQKNYPQEYFDYIKQHTGRSPQVISIGEFKNWWGDLEHFDLIKKISSKSFSFEWWSQSYPLQGSVCKSWEEIERFVDDKQWLFKKAHSMSGRGHFVISKDKIEDLKKQIEVNNDSSCVIEPLYERVRDVSALWLPEENKYIYYNNLVDNKFQWRACQLSQELNNEIQMNYPQWIESLNELKNHLQMLGYVGPFSVDAFTYKSEEGIKLYPGSEINPRKTMGWVTYHLNKIFNKNWVELGLVNKKISKSYWEKLKSDYLIVSPFESRFIWYFIGGNTEGELLQQKTKFFKDLSEGLVLDKA